MAKGESKTEEAGGLVPCCHGGSDMGVDFSHSELVLYLDGRSLKWI